MKKSLYIDIHAIQTVPPSCVNRDDTGSPKTAVYGGVERARVSSQAWKHAMRAYFKTIFAEDRLGNRTKVTHKILGDEIRKINPTLSEEKSIELARKTLDSAIGTKKVPDFDKEKNQYTTLFFISQEQVRELARLAADGEESKDAYKQAIKDKPSLDIALFGRMVADDPSLNYDAAAQVAHAISTHGVQTEYDYFTAVDDEKGDDESGAGYLGTVEFNSATLYRYATVNVTELAANLGKDTAKVVRGFVEAFTCSMPTGKQNTFANRTMPDMLYVTVRRDQPVNLSGAFEAAVKNKKEGFVQASCKALLDHAEKLYHSFADEPELALGCGDGEILDKYAEVLPLKKLLSRIEEYTAADISEE